VLGDNKKQGIKYVSKFFVWIPHRLARTLHRDKKCLCAGMPLEIPIIGYDGIPLYSLVHKDSRSFTLNAVGFRFVGPSSIFQLGLD
jgi:hypothetical protein